MAQTTPPTPRNGNDLLNRERAVAAMDAAGLDGLVATTPENVTYLTGYDSWTIYTFSELRAFGVLARSGERALVAPVDSMDYVAQRAIGDCRLYAYGTFHLERRAGAALAGAEARLAELREEADLAPGPAGALQRALAHLGLAGGRLGVDEGGLPGARWAELTDVLGRGAACPASRSLRSIRSVKTEAEVERLRHAARVTTASILGALRSARAGTLETEIEREIRLAMVRGGLTPNHCETSAGTRGGACFPPSDQAALRPGDVIRSDCGGRYRAYWADTGRTGVLGEPPPLLERYHRAVQAGIEAMLSAIRPGLPVTELADLAVATVRASGIEHYRRHHVGHGIGLEMYEAPLLVGSDGSRDVHGAGDPVTVLDEGMVINVELPYYELGLGGVQIEETVVVRAGGAEVLNDAPRDLVRGTG
jgi:Xaa-Pro aminopeptidase